ncbi:hypothetical protein KUTeg_007674 [Tegillarca granosa]|uniref:Uncharacterized protein n=1 Tax=Tegillarca granosa TaxID=220873 RepID=A0ABQ9FDZ9_TEGGR|nr:hypothetical protein KUTeg_007674 [Tegillarca granosa]
MQAFPCTILFVLVTGQLTTRAEDGNLGPFGPKYPITGAWFKDRFTQEEWNKTLTEFAKQDGDTILLGAPPIMLFNKSELLQDPDFKYCKGDSNGGSQNCFDDALQVVTKAGLNFSGFATYKYNEDYGDSILKCPPLDVRITGSRIYHRIVLPVNNVSSCPYPAGESVYILFTVFNGVDPHELLLKSAEDHKMSVYFSLPPAPRDESGITFYVKQFLQPYYEWVRRILLDHKNRYTNGKNRRKNVTLYGTLKGYYFNEDCPLINIDQSSYQFIEIETVGNLIRNMAPGKLFTISAVIDMNINLHGDSNKSFKKRAPNNVIIDSHVKGFEVLANSSVIDNVAVYEGRGMGRGAYYWQTQVNSSVSKIDPVLDKIIRYRNPSWRENVTFGEVFSGSNQELFSAIGQQRDTLIKGGVKVDFWFIIEAFEYLQDDENICLPIDPAGSGSGQIMDRTVKARIDRSLTGAGTTSQKIVSFAWDPDFTCTTEAHNGSLAVQIRSDSDRPIIADCFFHSPSNKSVVVIGYNLEGETQGFTVNWPDRDGQRHIMTDVHGYYFELDWGSAHQRLPSLMYTQLYDSYNALDLAMSGWVTVQAGGSYHPCTFTFSFDD